MSDLVVIIYPNEQKAEEIRQKLLDLQREYLIELEDAVIATNTGQGHVKLNQLLNPTAAGALTGSMWGLLIGALFLLPVVGPAIGAISGAALGAASGAISGALTDLGIDDSFMKELAAKLAPNSSALFLLIRKVTLEKILDAIQGTGGEVIKTSLDPAKEQALRDALARAPVVAAA
ncbi:MAG: hypothetical protein JWQ89_2035 [Devosia sp.]|uniref:DUF1269 domain-containing protein n=1 Tax=Devosia sp. TaxID=1871048 RepID=UPI00261D06E0|nr:DUF1269 domain-containing protein [Devosia sp.]MDB5540308.1 hypothetical protein [Devosia sp.]